MPLKLRRYERYYLVFFLIAFGVLILVNLVQVLTTSHGDGSSNDDAHRHKRSSIFDSRKKLVYLDNHVSVTTTQSLCTYWNCIDSFKCVDDGMGKISVYVYDMASYVDGEGKSLFPPASKEYVRMLWAIIHSKYIVHDPSIACVLIPSIDLLNRENFSGESAAKILASLPYWNNGTNHLLFNMIPGTSPDYFSSLEFPHGKAMVTGSGFTQRSYRRTFDLSIPLFNPHQRDIDFKDSSNSKRSIFIIAPQSTFYRSVYNQLITLADSRENIVILRKCANSVEDGQRCDSKGGQHSYPAVLTNAKFCLITRERRLASIYLHDILRAGCVPVICMDTYVMPFSEVLDWARAAIFVNEHRLDELVTILSSVLEDGNTYKSLREQGQFYYENYFKSLAKIALVTLDILNTRVIPARAPSYKYWNRPLVPSMPQSPFFVPLVPSQKQGFTALVLTYDRFELMKQVVMNIARSKNVAKIIVIWNHPEVKPPEDSLWSTISVPLQVIAVNVLSCILVKHSSSEVCNA